MHLLAKAIRTPRTKFHCNRLTTVQDIHYYASLSRLGVIEGHWKWRHSIDRIRIRLQL